MPRLPPAHHETSKRDSPNEPKIKEKQNKTIPDSNSNLTKLMTHHNQTKQQYTWFLKCVGCHIECRFRMHIPDGAILGTLSYHIECRFRMHMAQLTDRV
jgi:hypothetical protein